MTAAATYCGLSRCMQGGSLSSPSSPPHRQEVSAQLSSVKICSLQMEHQSATSSLLFH